jgi:hypothetical protein
MDEVEKVAGEWGITDVKLTTSTGRKAEDYLSFGKKS